MRAGELSCVFSFARKRIAESEQTVRCDVEHRLRHADPMAIKLGAQLGLGHASAPLDDVTILAARGSAASARKIVFRSNDLKIRVGRLENRDASYSASTARHW